MRGESEYRRRFSKSQSFDHASLRDCEIMYRFIGLASVLVLSALQMGCCSSPCGKGMGCGRTYWGAYADDPPTCEPCDNCGNFTGGNKRCKKSDCCEDDCDFQWARGQKVSLLGGLFNTSLFDCGGKGSCTQTSCGEPACGEPTCAEPGCGYGSNVSYESAPATTSWNGDSHMSNVSYSRNNHNTIGSSKPCNCGKKH